MLLRTIRQTEQAAREIGIYALVLDALDAEARKDIFSFEQKLARLADASIPVLRTVYGAWGWPRRASWA